MNDRMMQRFTALDRLDIGKNLNNPVVITDAQKELNALGYYQGEDGKWKYGGTKDEWESAVRQAPQGSLDYMATAYYTMNPITSQAKYGSAISGEMMPGAKRTEEQNKTGMNPLYSDPEFLKFIAQYGFDRYGRKVSGATEQDIMRRR